VAQNPLLFNIIVLTAGNNHTLLIQQALQFKPQYVVIENHVHVPEIKTALAHLSIQVLSGAAALEHIVTLPQINFVLTALVGYAGLKPTVAAIKAGKNIGLANKETLVVAGDLIMELAHKHNVSLLPIDSEHSAIYQCLVGEQPSHINKIILTASGGPFRGKNLEYLQTVTLAQALKHPNWSMGAKITIDSASLMNKGLEMIEAKWLFNVTPQQIEVVVHPQSIIHSAVEFTDGSIKCQMGLPDMRLPIQYALAYPNRIANNFEKFSFAKYPNLSFENPDTSTFKNLALAIQAMHKGGNMPCILNAANEIAVELFLAQKISFVHMSHLIEDTMHTCHFIPKPTLQNYFDTNTEARLLAQDISKKHK
jgi:1-deoxy-D-xylulose-5-phosphate reductoisomerase